MAVTGRASRAQRFFRYSLGGLIAAIAIAAFSYASSQETGAEVDPSSATLSVRVRLAAEPSLPGARSQVRGSVAPVDSRADFAVTPLVNPRVRRFVESENDFERSALLAVIIVPLVLILLIERELLATGSRPEARTFFAYGFPLIACFAMLVFVRLREYLQ